MKYYATKSAELNLILTAIDNKYIRDVKDETISYAKVSPLDQITHIWDSFVNIDDADHIHGR